MTVWDVASFHHITASGEHRVLRKAELLHAPLPRLRLLVPAMRLFTLHSRGALAPAEVVRGVDFLVLLGVSGMPLDPRLSSRAVTRRVVAFLLPDSPAAWRRCYAASSHAERARAWSREGTAAAAVRG